MSTAFRTCPLCEATCGLAVEHSDGALTKVRADPEDVFSKGFMCPKGVALKDLHEDPDRVRVPLIKDRENFREASYEEAFALIEERLPPLLHLHAALPALERSLSPAVVTVASISGLLGEPGMAIYAASKGGVVNFTRAAAVELGPRGIRVNCVCPGPTITGLTAPVVALDPSLPDALRANVPLRRLAQPEEIAAMICFLASPAASFVSGAVIPVDGGITANVGQQPPPSLNGHAPVAVGGAS